MHFPPLDFDQAPLASRATLKQARLAYGRVPNLLASLAESPTALDSYVQLTANLARGTLQAAQRERIALTISKSSGCGYCLAAHSWLGRRAQLSVQEIQQCISQPGAHPLTRLASRLVETQGALNSADLSEAVAAGFDRARILEVVACVAWMHFSNYLGNLMKPDIDFPGTDML